MKPSTTSVSHPVGGWIQIQHPAIGCPISYHCTDRHWFIKLDATLSIHNYHFGEGDKHIWLSFTGMPSAILSKNTPVKNFSSLLTHCKLMKTHGKLILKPLIYLSTNTQDELTLLPIALSLPWVCNSRSELAVSYLWDQPTSSMCIGSSELTVISLLTSLWDIQVSPLYAQPEHKRLRHGC